MAQLPPLTRERLRSPTLQDRGTELPPPGVLTLPEKAVQFGTGAFLRGFVDYFLDAANRAGRIDGRVVLVGSTGSGRDAAFNEQDGLYTLAIQGIVNGAPRRDLRVVAAVSRALSARDEWTEVLALARAPELELVFSNTTEVGIALDDADAAGGADAAPPRSFPGKLARFLLERARAFDGDAARAPVVVPCELIERNGSTLRGIVLALLARWDVEAPAVAWVRDHVAFCDTLVDRIVPGAPDAGPRAELEQALGYRDALLTVCEPYRLFAIEAPGAAARERLGALAAADPGIILVDDVAPYRERKVRLLNGAHTAFVSLALLAGCTTVREALEHPLVGAFLRGLLFEELVPSVDAPGADAFAREVWDRFANPYVRHQLFDITLQGATKMRVRVVPSILAYARRFGRPPRALALGFAAYLAFMRGELQAERRRLGLSVPDDAQGARVAACWSRGIGDEALDDLVQEICADRTLWGEDLTRVPGWVPDVTAQLRRLVREGALAALDAFLQGVTA